MTKDEVEALYTSSGLSSFFISEESRNYSSFLDAPPTAFPPRKEFDFFTHNLKKDGAYILKNFEKGRATLAFSRDEAHIVDMFLHKDSQGDGTVRQIVSNLYVDLKDNYIQVKNISLSSLSSGIIPWHKMGFSFYNHLDRQIVRTAISKAIGKIVNVKDVSKDDFVKYQLPQVIESAFIATRTNKPEMKLSSGNIPMYMEVIR